jgi:RNA polymerase sigma-70 factor (ECF subfamily)
MNRELDETLPAAATPEEEHEKKQIQIAVTRAVAALPSRAQIIFRMSRYDHLTYKEIAAILNISVKTVETQMGRALKSLRRQLAHLLSVLP